MCFMPMPLVVLSHSACSATAFILPRYTCHCISLPGCRLEELPSSLLHHSTPPPTQCSGFDRREMAPLLRLLLSLWKIVHMSAHVQPHAYRTCRQRKMLNSRVCILAFMNAHMHGWTGTGTRKAQIAFFLRGFSGIQETPCQSL